jgi:hypothetical protein
VPGGVSWFLRPTGKVFLARGKKKVGPPWCRGRWICRDVVKCTTPGIRLEGLRKIKMPVWISGLPSVCQLSHWSWVPLEEMVFLFSWTRKPQRLWYTKVHYLSEPRQFMQYSVWLRSGRSGFDPRQGHRIILLASASRPALGPTQPSIQWVPVVLSPGVKRGRGVTLTTHPTHPHLVPRLSMSRSIPPLPPCASMACSGTALLYFTCPLESPSRLYLEPVKSSPHNSHPVLLKSVLILACHIRLGISCGLFLQVVLTRILYAFLTSPCVLHALPASSSLIWFS